MNLLRRGSLARFTAGTEMNARSSRSHAIFTMWITHRRAMQVADDAVRQARVEICFAAEQPYSVFVAQVNQSAGESHVDIVTTTAKFNFVDLAVRSPCGAYFFYTLSLAYTIIVLPIYISTGLGEVKTHQSYGRSPKGGYRHQLGPFCSWCGSGGAAVLYHTPLIPTFFRALLVLLHLRQRHLCAGRSGEQGRPCPLPQQQADARFTRLAGR